MTTSFVILTVSLLGLGGFIELKRREQARGFVSSFSRSLAGFSPRLEAVYRSLESRFFAHARYLGQRAGMLAAEGAKTARGVIRHVVVLVAAKMVKAVKGEKLLYGNGAPSLYLKRLGVEMQNGEQHGVIIETPPMPAPVDAEKTE